MHTVATPPRITPRQRRIEELVARTQEDVYNKKMKAIAKEHAKARVESRRMQERADAHKKWRHEREGRLKKIKKLKNIRALKRVGAGVGAVGVSAYAFDKYKRGKNSE